MENAVRMVRQRDEGDCSVACLAMLCGVPYEAAAQAAVSVGARILWEGVSTSEFRKVAQALGHRIILRRNFDPDTDRGVLWLDGADWGHVAFLAFGLVLDTDGTVQPWVDYFARTGFTPTGLAVLAPEK